MGTKAQRKLRPRDIATLGHLRALWTQASSGAPSSLHQVERISGVRGFSIEGWAMPFAGLWRAAEWPLDRPLPWQREWAQTSPWSYAL